MKREERKQAKQQEWKEFVEGQAQSGLSVKEYCACHGVSQPAFYIWKRRLQKDCAAGGFQEVRLEGLVQPPSACLELVLPGGYMVRVPSDFDQTTLARLVRLMQGLV